MNPLDRLIDRVDSMIGMVERGEPIDFQKEARLDALDLTAAGIHYTREAIERTQDEDVAVMERITQEDGRIHGG